VSVDIERVGAAIREAAAAEILPRFRQLAAEDVREKGPGDLVTVADEATERRLEAALSGLLPGSTVVGEEAVAADPSLLARLDGAGFAWIIDPVDGTANFAAGIALFAVMVALVRDGATIAAWIHDPVTGVMAAGEAGGGTWADGRRLAVRAPVPAASMSGALTVRYGRRALVGRIAARTDRVGSVFQFRCAGQEYLALLRGQSHFSLYHRLLPWDHAAGQFLHREAGGHSARLDGSAYTPRVVDGGLLLAPDQASWDDLHAALLGAPPEAVHALDGWT